MTTSWATFWLSVRELNQRRTAGFSTGLTAPVSAGTDAMHASDRKSSFLTSTGLGPSAELGRQILLRRWRPPDDLACEETGRCPQQIGNLVPAFSNHHVGAGRSLIEAH